MFGPDPRDKTIEILHEQLRVAQATIAELQRALIGMTDARALAMATMAKPRAVTAVPVKEGEQGAPQENKLSMDYANPIAHLRTHIVPNPNLRAADMTPRAIEESFKMPVEK